MHYDWNPRFPAGFLFGASSAAWQVEGATTEGGRTPAIIDLNSQKKAPFVDNKFTADHYHRHAEDVALMKECGLTSYRFSIAWPRIIPAADGAVNPDGIAFYDRLIDELLAAGITPIVTLYHYDMPLWVEEELGGWRSREVIPAFAHYVRTCFEAFGDRVKYWLSINEQNMQICYGDWLGVSKGVEDWFRDKWKINHIMNLCHATAVNLCHELVDGGRIGPVPGYVPIYPETCRPEDQIAAMNAEEFTEKIWCDTYAYGDYSPFLYNYWRNHDIDPDIRPGDIETMKRAKIDFLAVNCYRSNTAKHAPADAESQEYLLNASGKKGELTFSVVPGQYALTRNPYVEYTDWDWEIDPVAMRYALRYLWDHYRLPMVITENGLGAHESKSPDGKVHDPQRLDYIRDNLYQIGLAIEDGVEVFGYNAWTFTDLLSTGNGMAKRYGFVFIDTTDEEQKATDDVSTLSLTRIPKDSYYWYRSFIASGATQWGEEMSD
ncbi:glycoside hydrolase family 1 protein [Actinomyces qiguomingii]|uniref:glycoside hydrolase family 1 protein n=1 Tax=Actinomyces qiguomingii TaxID=2057800 RepID=UPI000CA07624|nr:glycoside hydrolase family 1 protein [Actinomyces qiguomingii]